MVVLKCNHCMGKIQVDNSSIGEFAQCPLCDKIVAISDPFPAIGSDKFGYKIESVVSTTLAVNVYQATSLSSPLPPATRVFLQIPSTFLLKRVANFEVFSTAVIKSGSMNIQGAPRIIDYSLISGKPYFAFDFFDSTTLESFIANTGPSATSNALRIIKICANILSNAWNQHGVIHQNITPGTIRINALQNIMIMDLGVSQVLHLDKNLLKQGFNIWNQHFMSPELALTGHGLSPSCDIYALGMVFYFLLTGRTPNENLSKESLPADPAPDLRSSLQEGGEEVVSLFQAMTANNSAQRINNWEEVTRRIDLILNTSTAAPALNNAQSNLATLSPPPIITSPVATTKVTAQVVAAPITTRTADSIMKVGSKTEKNRRMQKLKQKNSQKSFFENNMALVITCLIVFIIAVPLITFLVKRENKKSKRKRQVSIEVATNGNSAPPPPSTTSTSIVPENEKVKLKTYSSRKKVNAGLGEKSELKGTTSVKPTKEQTLKQKIRDVGEYLKKNPNDVEIVLKRYEAIVDEARAKKRLDIIDLVQNLTANISDKEPPVAISATPSPAKEEVKTETIKKTETEKEDPVTAAVMNDIRKKVNELLKNKDYDNAIWFVQEYSGAYSDETSNQRKALVAEIEKQKPPGSPKTVSATQESDPSTQEAEGETETKEKAEENVFLEKTAAILKKYSLTLNPEAPQKLFIQLMKTRIPKRRALKLAMELKTLTDQAEKKDFTSDNVDLIEALRLFCKRNAGGALNIKIYTSPPKTVSSYDNLSDFFTSLESGDRVKLNPGTFTFDTAEISKNNVTIIGKDAVLEGGRLSIRGDDCSISDLHFKNVKVRTFKSNNISMNDCVLNESSLILTKSNNFHATNTFFTSVSLDNSTGFKANHCTFASLDEETPALRVETDDFQIFNSILYAKGYAIVFSKKRTNKKCRVFHSIIFGEKAFCARETESEDYRKNDIAMKKTKVKLFLKVKNNIYTSPEFKDPWKTDWRLEEGEPGTDAASDKTDCGVIWP